MGSIRSCCCCISLWTGGLIIGLFSCVYAIYNFFRCLTEILHYDDYYAEIKGADELDKEFTKIILYVLLVTQPIRFAAGVALIVGVLKKKSMLLSPWLAVQVLGVFGIIRTVFIFLSSKHTVNERNEYLVEISIGTLLTLWWWLVIYSLYRYIKLGEIYDTWDPVIFPHNELQDTPEVSMMSNEGLDQRRRTIISISSAV